MSTVRPVFSTFDRECLLRKAQTPAARLSRAIHIPIATAISAVLVFAVALLNLIDVQVDKDVVGLDGQILLKLAVTGLAGGYGMLGVMTDSRSRRLLLSFPLFLVLTLVGLYFLSALTSITPGISLVSSISIPSISIPSISILSISILSVLLMTVTAMVQLGLVPFLTITFHAMSAFIVLSWVVYFVWPKVGVFMDPITDGEFTRRMSGLAHSNTLGQYGGLTTVLGVTLYQFYGQRSKWRLVVILPALTALLCSLSRTSAIAIVVVCRQSIFTPRNTKWMLCGGAVVLLGGAALLTQANIGRAVLDKMALFSKSGDSEQLTSATGRADIWWYAGYLISKRPLTGYGAATSKYFLEDYSLYTHNLLLNIAFSTGIFGGLVALLLLLQQSWSAITKPHVVTSAVIGFILVNGLFENVISSILSGIPTMLWGMATAWSQVAKINGGEEAGRSSTWQDRIA